MATFATAVVLALGNFNGPVERYLGTGGSGGLGDVIVWGSLVLSVLVVSFAVWNKLAFRERDLS